MCVSVSVLGENGRTVVCRVCLCVRLIDGEITENPLN